MNLKQQQNERNYFLRKAYEAAYDYAPSAPLTVSLNPSELAKIIGFDAMQTRRIMHELVSEGYVQSSLGMGTLIVTQRGLDYLRTIDNEPITSINNFPDSIKNEFHILKDSNIKEMKQSQKLDLILKELYKHKNDGKFYSIGQICKSLNIPLDSNLEINKLGHRLESDGFIRTSFTRTDCSAELTTHGIDYCEENSYSYKGQAVITNNYSFSIVNSQNSNIISHAADIKITYYNEIRDAIEKIKECISNDSSIDRAKASEILECLNEIQKSIDNNHKPKFAIKSLIEITAGLSSIASWITTLGQCVGLIPTP